ncbi:non-homologous end-joining DNA ligase [Nocardioides panacisoli]|uniref:non-homologous end-joining DNA ligase n=1 Tax=Nocardioides panacisoli TaxID=627624 RepID=UPI001C631A08|nr:non-homologous end-joining DNA ligase [Nocardioides panacisoli]QYJ05751.1 non-homologous end-joining DNA ligase [Nocardioides panacisoli]
MRPMLATPGDRVPSGESWRHEVKWDGVRALVSVRDGAVRLHSRNGNDVSEAWPELRTPPAAVSEAVLDGEIIALNDHGIPDFRTLAERIHVRRQSTVARLAARVPATLMVFDLLDLDGTDLTARPWSERRARLEELDLEPSGWQVPPTYDDGAMLHEATRAQGLEGIVSKRTDARYRPGERTRHWLKFAHRHRGSYVVGGWRPQTGTRARLAALLVGEPTAEGLAYRGRVGSGIGPAQARQLTDLVGELSREESPFSDEVPRVDADGTHWLAPVLVVDVDSHGTGHDRLRQPSFRGVRDDLAPEDLLDG